MINNLKKEIHDIISGKSQVRNGTIIQTIANHLERSTATGERIGNQKQNKSQETTRLEIFIDEHGLWENDIDQSQFVSAGAEQKVYLKDDKHVLKLNDSIYFESWPDYFRNLLLHNFFFEDTAYRLIGFAKQNDVLYVVVEQPYVAITDMTDLNKVKTFLSDNGFINTRNNDYFNPELGIILEALHDENVLTANGVLYFIDTVFYLSAEFWTAE